jgi:hypothetical protein
MIVWGGTSFGDYLNTGGRYDPVADAWTPTSTSDAPSGRKHHTVVWTGTRMVVWGGGAEYSGTGGRYDPTADTWAPTSTVGAPSNRTGHTAIWTGSRMVIWGGSSGGGQQNGGKYVLGHCSDDDGDGLSEQDGDCNDSDPDVHASPAEVTGLRFAEDGVTLEWDSAAPSAGSATAHDVVAGRISDLPVGSGAETCLESSITAASTVVPELPPTGHGSWYLVRGRNACGIGSYGSDSNGTERVSAACP